MSRIDVAGLSAMLVREQRSDRLSLRSATVQTPNGDGLGGEESLGPEEADSVVWARKEGTAAARLS